MARIRSRDLPEHEGIVSGCKANKKPPQGTERCDNSSNGPRWPPSMKSYDPSLVSDGPVILCFASRSAHTVLIDHLIEKACKQLRTRNGWPDESPRSAHREQLCGTDAISKMCRYSVPPIMKLVVVYQCHGSAASAGQRSTADMPGIVIGG